MIYHPRAISGFDLLGEQQVLDEQGAYWIGRAQEWATGAQGIALYTDESVYDYGLLIFLQPAQVRGVLAFLTAVVQKEE